MGTVRLVVPSALTWSPTPDFVHGVGPTRVVRSARYQMPTRTGPATGSSGTSDQLAISTTSGRCARRPTSIARSMKTSSMSSAVAQLDLGACVPTGEHAVGIHPIESGRSRLPHTGVGLVEEVVEARVAGRELGEGGQHDVLLDRPEHIVTGVARQAHHGCGLENVHVMLPAGVWRGEPRHLHPTRTTERYCVTCTTGVGPGLPARDNVAYRRSEPTVRGSADSAEMAKVIRRQ